MRKRLLMMAFSALNMLAVYAQAENKLEAENATHLNCEVVEDAKYSGGKALALKENNAKITLTYNATESGKFTVYVGYDSPWGAKVFNLAVNGNTSSIQTKDKATEEFEVGTFLLNKGDNTIEVTPSWTWFIVDYIRIASGSSSQVEFNIATAPVDAKATEAAKKVYSFLHDNFGQKTISGIMTGDMTTANGDVTQHEDVKAVYTASGKYPALVGFDFMNATGKEETTSWYKEYTEASMTLAKDLYRRGGIPAFTWHWRDPSRNTNDFYCTVDGKTACTTRISQAMNADGSWNTSSTLYKNMVKDIHTVADYFLELQNQGVACIFRPLHEASGAWFWWGAEDAAKCVKLYQLVHDEMVNTKGVHNVIWVWNPCTVNDADWNPGDNYYDVVSIDIYNDAYDYSSNYASFDKLKTMTSGKKIIALSENGPIPDIVKEFEEEAVWSWWMPWYQSWNGKFVDKTSVAEWKKCMSDDRVITLEDLSAGWGTYTAITSPKDERTEDEMFYDLSGRAIPYAPTKGIYIRGQKKIVIR